MFARVCKMGMGSVGRAHGWTLCVLVVSGMARKCSEPGEDCRETKCCTNQLTTCYKKNKFWAGCKESCTPGIDPLDPPKVRTPWSCQPLRPDDGEAEDEDQDQQKLTDLPELPKDTSGLSFPSAPAECDGGVTKGFLGFSGLDVPTYAAGGGGKVRHPGLFLGHNSGYSILRSCARQYSPGSFALFQLLPGSLTFTVDLSRVGCACNVAFYLISQPARAASGLYNPGPQGDFYCDANKVQGQWCPEVDIMEANNRVFAATPHKCDEPTFAGHYTNCDRSGRGQSTRDIPGSYGLGSEYKINTKKPFMVITNFHSEGMTTILRQDGREVVLGHSNCPSEYFAKLSQALSDGMAIRITYWGRRAKTMAWLDEPPCASGERCTGTNAGFAIISNIALNGSLAPPILEPTPTPEVTTPMFMLPTLPPYFETTQYPYVWPEPEWEPEYVFTEMPTEPPAVSGQFPAVSTQPPAPAPALTATTQRRSWGGRFHMTPKLAMAMAIAALSGAGLLIAAVAPCFRQTSLPPAGMIHLQGPPAAPYMGNFGEHPDFVGGGRFVGAPYPGYGFNGHPMQY